MEGGKRAVYVRSRGTRKRGSGRKRETIVDEFGGGPACEMRIARLGWLHGRPSWVQTGWEKLVGPSPSFSLPLSFSSSSSSSSSLFIFFTFLLRFFLPLSREAAIAFLFCLCYAALHCSLALFLSFSLFLSSS